MAFSEPDLPASMRSNVYEEDTFKLRVLFGSTAITSYLSKDATITRETTGQYEITLPKPYLELTDFKGAFTLHAAGAHLFWSVKSSTLDTDGKCIVECRTESGTATDPSSGDKVTLTICASGNPLNALFGG